jgi:predicted transposase YdaD
MAIHNHDESIFDFIADLRAYKAELRAENEQEARDVARQEGRVEGREEVQRATVRRMRELGLDAALIEECLGVSLEELDREAPGADSDSVTVSKS